MLLVRIVRAARHALYRESDTQDLLRTRAGCRTVYMSNTHMYINTHARTHTDTHIQFILP